MWDEDDFTGRVVQFVCGVPLLGLGLWGEYYDWTRLNSSSWEWSIAGLGVGAVFLGARCIWYAVTGSNNINREELNTLRSSLDDRDFFDDL